MLVLRQVIWYYSDEGLTSETSTTRCTNLFLYLQLIHIMITFIKCIWMCLAEVYHHSMIQHSEHTLGTNHHGMALPSIHRVLPTLDYTRDAPPERSTFFRLDMGKGISFSSWRYGNRVLFQGKACERGPFSGKGYERGIFWGKGMWKRCQFLKFSVWNGADFFQNLVCERVMTLDLGHSIPVWNRSEYSTAQHSMA